MKNYKEIIKNYFENHALVESNIKSFDDFLSRRIQEIVKDTQEIIPTIIPSEVSEFKIKLGKVSVEKPVLVEADGSTRSVYPFESRLRNLTYWAPIHLDVSAYVDNVERESFTTLLGKIPVMVKSKFCHLSGLNRESLIKYYEDPDDPGGYFILNGNERVLIIVEDLVSNKFFIRKNKVGPSAFTAKIFSEKGSYRIPHTIEQMKDGMIYISFTRFKRVPIIAVIKALGLVRDQDINNFICEDKIYDDVFINLSNSVELKTQKNSLDFLSKKIGFNQVQNDKEDRVSDMLDKYLLPHIGIKKEDRMLKAYNLCKYIKKFLMVARDGLTEVDKDHYMNKRLKLSGDLMADLFRVNLASLVQDMLYNFQRLVKRGKFQSIKIIIRDQLLTGRIKSAMATGSWVGGRKGISQNIDRTDHLATLSHLQRVVSLLSSSQENFEARSLHPSHWGRLCLGKDTNVLLADKKTTRTLDQLQNCWKHHNIITYDTKNKNFLPSNLVGYFSSNPKLMNKFVFNIHAEGGRSVIATEDHPFLTPYGWVDAGKLKKGDLVAVCPMLECFKTPNPPTVENGKVVVNEDIIKRLYPKRYKHYIKELKERGLLPFTVNNYWAEIIARFQGYLFTDGHCGKSNLEFYCGSLDDAEEIANDIRQLNFEPSKISKKISKSVIKGRKVVTTTYRFTKGGALYALLVALGTPVGKKTNSVYTIPKWLNDAELSVKREFLSAYMGGDGGKARYCVVKDRMGKERRMGKIKIEDLFFHKEISIKKGGVKFARELAGLFKLFDVDVKRVDVLDGYVRKDGSRTVKINLVFSKSNKNKKNLITKIGYRYCKAKGELSLYLGEWLRLHEKTINDKINLKRRIRRLYKEGLTPKKISDMVGINYNKVNSWLFSRKYEKTSVARSNLLPFNDWLSKATENLEGKGLVWGKVDNITKVDIDDVRDITTMEDTHTFIANGFVTHNCPVETPEGTPIGLRKNLAMLSRISEEDVGEDKVKKLLAGYGLNQNG